MPNDIIQTCRAWIKQINSQNLEGLEELASKNHTFFVEGEPPVVGRERLRPSWTGYFAAFPDYVIYEDELHELQDTVYVVGHTTGSHVPDESEVVPSSVIWRCVVDDLGKVSEWSIYPGTKVNRDRFGFDDLMQ